jgi:hypothetical protein
MIPFNLGKIGQLLREAREKMGLTVDEVSNALFIREWFLLKRWQFRKRGAQENQPMNVPWSVIDQLNKNY